MGIFFAKMGLKHFLGGLLLLVVVVSAEQATGIDSAERAEQAADDAKKLVAIGQSEADKATKAAELTQEYAAQASQAAAKAQQHQDQLEAQQTKMAGYADEVSRPRELFVAVLFFLFYCCLREWM